MTPLLRAKTMRIFLDIDGCITDGKGKAIDLIAMQALKQRIAESPYPTGLCTGRSAAYVEAIAQLLNIQHWCICENGAYVYQPVSEKVIFHPELSAERRQHMQYIKQQCLQQPLHRLCTVELGKEICVSLNPQDISVNELCAVVTQFFAQADLNVARSTTAVDITPKGINKGSALQWLCQREGWSLDSVIGVGDSQGDICFLSLCGVVVCPANAVDEVKALATRTAKQPSTRGLVELYDGFAAF